MAETYHVLNWRKLPARLAATLAAGLRDNSRVAMAQTNSKADAKTLLLATCADALKLLLWQNTRDGQSGRNPPASILAALTSEPQQSAESVGFDSPEEFRTWRKNMIGKE